MKLKLVTMAGLLAVLSACMSTSPQIGPDASAWSDYLSWYKVTPEAVTGDPTGVLGAVHDGRNAFRQIYVNSVGAAVNRGTQGYPYPAGTILLKESFSDAQALAARRNPDLTIMIKLATGQSPATGDWEYVMGADGSRRGTGDSGQAAFCRNCHLYAAATDYNFINSRFFANNR
ncbi:MAG: cytochrome P460 family protein [Pseudohongiella sp.]|nr:cytochrome P460 family protein [Pseudohongiella sp.]